ncbi:MAG: LysR family transcriptional regulator [Oscillospiraceae bacterium]|nr:LysR family transcriptional regulator [Oscillospiraceae bacterium]
MNILHLKYAVEVAKTQSISKAAENLYMGQPNLSRAIKELEESLGITIFKRTSKGITTTPDGDEFLRRARRIVAQVDEVEEIYRNGKTHKQTFSVCVPRASYFSVAMAEFSKHISLGEPAEIFYKETNSMRTITNVTRGDFNLGIVRYQAAFEKYFVEMFAEKKLEYDTVAEFTYQMAVKSDSPLAKKENISIEELKDYIEITHGDPYVPSLPLIDVKKAELSEHVDKRIYVFERATQFMLLGNVPNTFMWMSPVPQCLLDSYGLVLRKVSEHAKPYKDVLIYRKDYKLSALDKQFITDVCDAKHQCFP